MRSLSCLIKDFYVQHRNVIHYNKNLLISAIITAIADIVIVTSAASLFNENYLSISSVSLFADFIIFSSTFLVLLYKDNIIKKERLRQDLAKFLTTLGLAEIIYLVTKFTTTYLFFQFIHLNSSQISIATTIIGWVLYIIASNIFAKRTKIID